MNKNVEPKFEAIIGGPFYDGMKIMLHEPNKEMIHIIQAMDKTGQMIEVCRVKYRLISEGPPLRYEVCD